MVTGLAPHGSLDRAFEHTESPSAAMIVAIAEQVAEGMERVALEGIIPTLLSLILVLTDL